MSSCRILGLYGLKRPFHSSDGEANSTIGFGALKNLPIDTNIKFLALLVTKIADVTCYILYGASYTEKCNSYIYAVTDFFVANR